ncbi:hypothetical protein NIES970_24510 [[Synechococcus] sp. NIES-970]|uniref:DUF3134 domain-containing protein n=1 Tax=Picosynechococcus sp. NKBG15041c TaxID=1407650 RepID=UPI0004632462|nr:DUF3134 domain-containing protein [Picosynechococcus sp. NKBG15041c]BAW97499.1 hypothetical protein NIES970_24510 [[Synechococcus] sp. NIES-970]
MKNPSLRQEPRYAPASVIALEQKTSLLEWLEENGRIIYREKKEDFIDDMIDDQDLSELMDDDGFEEEDDDDAADLD